MSDSPSNKKQPLGARPRATKWNARYAYANKDAPKPANVLINAADFLPAAGVALDLACGRAGNAFYLAARGLSVHAWDISSAAINEVLTHCNTRSTSVEVHPSVRDVIAEPPKPDSFDVIVVSRFLDRPLCAYLSAALKPNGVLYYQTFIEGLSNKQYLLQPGELPMLFADLQPCFTMESPVNENGFSEAQFVGRKAASL